MPTSQTYVHLSEYRYMYLLICQKIMLTCPGQLAKKNVLSTECHELGKVPFLC